MAANGISTRANKQLRQIAKLDLAMAKRKGQGITEGSGTWSTDGVDDDTANSYRSNNTYDITALPTNYVADTVNDIANPDGLLPKRPWVSVGVIATPLSIAEAVDGGSIPDLQIWYDGADTSTYVPNAMDEGQITQWTDKSNFAHNANPNGGSAKPTYENTVLQNGYGYLEFDGNDELSVNPFTALDGATAWSMFVVANVTDLTTDSGLTGTENGDFRIRIDANGATSLRADPTAFVYANAGTITEDTWHLWSLIYDGSLSGTARLVGRLDKTALTNYTGTPAASVTAGSNTMFIGRDGFDADYYHDGYIAEVIMFNRALNSTEYANVENYLTTKWGL
jgi:hypothetical protein